jgi:hypothetical protein
VAFAGYGFNKSHSTAYGLIAWETAFLKAHYPVEFMAALLSCEMESTERISEHVDDARRMKIEILPPDINRSEVDFGILGDKITFGLAPFAVSAKRPSKPSSMNDSRAVRSATSSTSPNVSIPNCSPKAPSKLSSKPAPSIHSPVIAPAAGRRRTRCTIRCLQTKGQSPGTKKPLRWR